MPRSKHDGPRSGTARWARVPQGGLESAAVRSVRRTRRPLLALALLVALLLIGYVLRALGSGSGGAGSDSRAASATASATGSSSVTAARSSTRPTGPRSTTTTSAGVPLSALPPQVGTTVRLIRSGGPFPYPRNDGVTFHNNEQTLPRRADGYYREYTVTTPGSPDRGPRRIVTGRGGEFYYTSDHYASFRLVDVNR